jgi:hypothetical protein
MDKHLLPVDYLKRCLRNLESVVRPERERLNKKMRSGGTWTAEESDFMDGKGNITDETILVDDYVVASNKEEFLGSLSRDKQKAYHRLMACAYPLPILSNPPPPINVSNPPATTASRSHSRSSASSSSPLPPPPTDTDLESDAEVPFVPLDADAPFISTDTGASSPKPPSATGDVVLDDQTAIVPATQEPILRKSRSIPRPFRLGYPYAHVGPPESSILAMPELMAKLNIELYHDDYDVSLLQ